MNMDGIWLAEERARLMDAGQRLHTLPNEIAIAGLREQLDEHVGPGWWAMVFYADGRGMGRGQHPMVAGPAQPLWERMRGFGIVLNRELHLNGHWIVALNGAREVTCLWRDGDGDLHAVWEVIPDPGTKLEDWKDADILALAAQVLAETAKKIGLLELNADQQVKRAQGERPTTH